MSASPSPPLANVQVLRAAAALLVACVHVYEQSAKYDQPLVVLGLFRNWGDSGVDIFFVISGFIMVYVQRRRPSTASAFLGHRLYRVVPLYWTLSLLYVALYVTWPQLFTAATIEPGHIVQSLSFTTFLFDGSFPLLYLGWTLEYEMFFYAAFALGILAGTTAAAVLVCTALILLGCHLLPLEAVVFEFVFGCALGLVHGKPWLRRHARALLLVGAGLLVATLVDPAFAFDNRALLWGVPAVLLVAGAVNLPQTRRPSLHFLGDASYSIYLIQVFTISAYYKAADAMAFDLPNDLHALLCLAVTTLAGCVTYLVVEKPLIELRRADFRSIRRASARLRAGLREALARSRGLVPQRPLS